MGNCTPHAWRKMRRLVKEERDALVAARKRVLELRTRRHSVIEREDRIGEYLEARRWYWISRRRFEAMVPELGSAMSPAAWERHQRRRGGHEVA